MQKKSCPSSALPKCERKKILRRPAFQSNAMWRNTDLLKALGQKQWATPEWFVYKKCEMDLVQDRKCLPAFSWCFRKFRLLYTSIHEVGSEYHTLEKSLGPQTGLSRYHAGVYRCIGIQGNWCNPGIVVVVVVVVAVAVVVVVVAVVDFLFWPRV